MRLLLLALAAGCATPDAPDDGLDSGDSGGPGGDTAPGDTAEHAILVAPYLQSVSPTEAWVLWESADGDQGVVEYGPSESMGFVARGKGAGGGHGVQHEVQLVDLEPDTTYWYVARTGATASSPTTFRTPPTPGSRTSFQLVAVSDMQRDDAWPTKWATIVEEGIVPYVTGRYDADLPAALGLMLLPGDLVDNGWQYTDWTDDFFAGVAPLAAQVPLYPVPGNHEGNSPAYFQYFRLPDNGVEGFGEHWFTTTYDNVRVIGLDSNSGYRLSEQLDWLDDVLADACDDDTVEFVFAELHHPYLSELWPDGELDYTGDVVGRLEAFSTTCGKPSVHFFGHTHGYSRGESRDHAHLWVDVASAGGALDRWVEGSNQTDYPQFSVSQAEYGFVVVEVEPGAFTLRRVSLGTPESPRYNEATDEITVRLDPVPPDVPAAVAPVGAAVVGAAVTLRATPFAHGAGGAQGGAHWQVSADCAGFADPVVDRWEQHQNWFREVDTQAGVDLAALAVEGLAAGDWCWRVRYRDRGLAWSDWSAPAAFTVGG